MRWWNQSGVDHPSLIYISTTLGSMFCTRMPRRARRRLTWCGNESRANWDDAKLPLSAGKSVWIAATPEQKRNSTNFLKKGTPRSKAWQRIWGWIPLGGRRRRLATHKARFSKGQQRQRRLVQLAPTQSAKTKACKQSVFGAALYGHMANGACAEEAKVGTPPTCCSVGEDEPWINRGGYRAGLLQA